MVQPTCTNGVDGCMRLKNHKSGRCQACEREANGTKRATCTNGVDGCMRLKNHKSGRCQACEREANGTKRATCTNGVDGCMRLKHHKSGRCIACERDANGTERATCTNGVDGCMRLKNHKSGRCQACEREANGTKRATCTNGVDGCMRLKHHKSGRCIACERDANGTERATCTCTNGADGCMRLKHHKSGRCIACERDANGTERATCDHGKRRDTCADCLTKDQQIKTGRFCLVCPNLLGKKRMRIHGGSDLCATCYPSRGPRSEHLYVQPLLDAINFPPEAVDNALFGKDCDVDKQRRPDKLFAVRSDDDARILGFVKLGDDENSHHDHPSKTREEHIQCELGKVGNQFDALVMLVHIEDVLRARANEATLTHRMLKTNWLAENGETSNRVGFRGVPIYFVKWNPDGYDGAAAGTKSPNAMDVRVPAVAAYVNELLHRIKTGDLGQGFDLGKPHVSFLYYHSKARDIVQAFQGHQIPVVMTDGPGPMKKTSSGGGSTSASASTDGGGGDDSPSTGPNGGGSTSASAATDGGGDPASTGTNGGGSASAAPNGCGSSGTSKSQMRKRKQADIVRL